jgi:hypothetical protein
MACPSTADGVADTLDAAKAALRAGGGASAIAEKSRRDMLDLIISDRMPLPLERRLTLDVSARVARIVGRASNKEGESERS